MRPYHFILSILIAAAWGLNFVFVRLGLHDIPPLFLCTLRFFLSSIPAIFFIKKPDIPLKVLLTYGLFTFGLQFSLLFMGMHAGMPTGLTSLVVQVQVFFSLFFAVLFLNEKLNTWLIVGALTAFSGIGLVWINLTAHTSWVGFILVISGAASWGFGNYVTKKMGPVNGIALVVWGSFTAFPILLIASLLFEGSHQIIRSMQHLSLLTTLSVCYIVYISTWFGYGAWNWLLAKYPVSTIAPFTLLVPVFGILSASIVFDEPMQSWQKGATLLVMLGLCINSLGPKLQSTRLWQRFVMMINPVREEA